MGYHTFRCEVCGHEHPDTHDYDDVTCEQCGREHVYDEGIHLKISPEDALFILHGPALLEACKRHLQYCDDETNWILRAVIADMEGQGREFIEPQKRSARG